MGGGMGGGTVATWVATWVAAWVATWVAAWVAATWRRQHGWHHHHQSLMMLVLTRVVVAGHSILGTGGAPECVVTGRGLGGATMALPACFGIQRRLQPLPVTTAERDSEKMMAAWEFDMGRYGDLDPA